jgi:hypothetical protein
MAIINFDREKRRDTKEPQTTKDELLRPPPPASDSAIATELTTPRGAVGPKELYSGNATWDFNGVGADATPSLNHIAQVKQEMATPVPGGGVGNYKRQRSPADAPQKPLSKRAKMRARQTSDERYGRHTGVIDLTLDESDSEEENEQPLPERQFVPGADDVPDTPRFASHQSPSPPRTFTTGLSPIAAHHRPAPIVHRSKPPIKPGNRRQSSQLASPAPTSRAVFNRTPRMLTPTNVNNTSQGNPSISGSTHNSQRAPANPSTANPSTANSSTTPVVQKTGGPFVDDEDSGSDEEPEKKVTRGGVPRTSVARLTDRPRFDTPVRANFASMLEESRRMRERAHTGPPGETEGLAGSPLADNSGSMDVDQPEVSTQSSEDQSFLGVPRPR